MAQKLNIANKSAKPGYIVPIFFIIFSLLVTSSIMAKDKPLANYLPDIADMKGWKQPDSPQVIEGTNLFMVINGGAELYLRYGFKRAGFVSYYTPKGIELSVQLFEMETPIGAKNVFKEKIGPKGEKLKIGENALFEDYYLNFTQGQFQVTIAGPDPDHPNREEILILADAISKKISQP